MVESHGEFPGNFVVRENDLKRIHCTFGIFVQLYLDHYRPSLDTNLNLVFSSSISNQKPVVLIQYLIFVFICRIITYILNLFVRYLI